MNNRIVAVWELEDYRGKTRFLIRYEDGIREERWIAREDQLLDTQTGEEHWVHNPEHDRMLRLAEETRRRDRK